MKKFFALAAIAAGAFSASSAFAYPFQDGGITAQDVAGVLQSKGYQAQVGTDNDGDPKISSSTDGVKFTVFFYGCNHTPRCTSITFQAGFHLEGGFSVTKINDWNKDKRFLKGWLDNVNDPYTEMDVDTEHGFTSQALATYIDDWAAGIPEFKNYIGF